MLEDDHSVDFTDISITENTRGAYPINFIQNALIPCVAGHPTDIVFLTCDAFGVLPPVSSLAPTQAMYHFVSLHQRVYRKGGWDRGGSKGAVSNVFAVLRRAVPGMASEQVRRTAGGNVGGQGHRLSQ